MERGPSSLLCRLECSRGRSPCAPVFSQPVVDNLSALGSILIFCVGVNLAFGPRFRVANMLPALVLGAAYTAVFL